MRKFIPWTIGIVAFVLIGFVLFNPFTPREPIDYDLVNFEEECEEDYETYYTCPNGEEILDCLCYEGELDCLDEPESYCSESTPEETETESTGSITVNPNPVVLRAPICFDKPCDIDTKFTISSSGPWYIDSTRNYATKTCGDAPGGSYWSICPTEGGAGDTDIIIKNRVYGVSTPDYYDTLLTDGVATWILRLEDDWYVSAEVDAYLELSKV